jgi:hypothetical protein
MFMKLSKWVLAFIILPLVATPVFSAFLGVKKSSRLEFIKECPISDGISFDFPNDVACTKINKHTFKTLLFREAKICINLQQMDLPKRCTIERFTQTNLEAWPQTSGFSQTIDHNEKNNFVSAYQNFCSLPDTWFVKGTCKTNNKRAHWKTPFLLSYPLEGHPNNTPPEVRIYPIP